MAINYFYFLSQHDDAELSLKTKLTYPQHKKYSLIKNMIVSKTKHNSSVKQLGNFTLSKSPSKKRGQDLEVDRGAAQLPSFGIL